MKKEWRYERNMVTSKASWLARGLKTLTYTMIVIRRARRLGRGGVDYLHRLQKEHVD